MASTLSDRLKNAMNKAGKGASDFWSRQQHPEFLPGFSAAMALMVAADGVIEDSEVDGVLTFVETEDALQAWDLEARTAAFEEALELAKQGPMKAATLLGRVSKLNGTAEAETIAEACAALAAIDGNVAEAERKMFGRICAKLGKDPKNYGI
jgi:tellurite resistance protein